MMSIENINILSDWRDIVRYGSDSNGTLSSFLKIKSIKNAKDDQNKTVQIQKMSHIFIVLFSCFLKNFPAPGKGGGPFFLAKRKATMSANAMIHQKY